MECERDVKNDKENERDFDGRDVEKSERKREERKKRLCLLAVIVIFAYTVMFFWGCLVNHLLTHM